MVMMMIVTMMVTISVKFSRGRHVEGSLAPVLARVGQLPNFFHQNFPPSSFSTSLVNIVVIARFIKMITKISCTNSVARVLDCVHEYVRNASFISFCVSYYLTRDVALPTKMDGLNDQMDDQSDEMDYQSTHLIFVTLSPPSP